MKLVPRPYQKLLIKLVGDSLRSGFKRVIAWMATGGGKTASFITIVYALVMAQKKVLIVMRRRGLIFQTAKSIEKFTGLPASIIMGNEKGFDPNCSIQVCSIDTISKRMHLPEYQFLLDFDYIHIDECHDTTSPKYREFLERFEHLIWIGWTATPFETGKKYLADTGWQDIVSSVTAAELRDMGYLVPERTYAPKKIDTSDIKANLGDFDKKALAQRAMESKIIGDTVDVYKTHGENRRAFCYAVNKEHSKMLAEAFRQHGIPAIHVDESHSQDERDAAIKKTVDGTNRILCSVDVFSTGTDVPIVSCGIYARPTKSEILYVQQIGRVLRPYKQCATCKEHLGADPVCYRCGSEQFTNIKKDAIILDQANNCERFGLAYDPRYPRLVAPDKKKKKVELEDEVKTKTCDECYGVYSSEHSECPYCGHKNAKTKREIEQEEGELERKRSEDLRYNRMIVIKNDLMKFSNPRWKPSAKWSKLHAKYGDEIFEFKRELEIPSWVRGQISRNKKGIKYGKTR